MYSNKKAILAFIRRNGEDNSVAVIIRRAIVRGGLVEYDAIYQEVLLVLREVLDEKP